MDDDTCLRWLKPHCQCCLGAEFLEKITTENCYEEMLRNVFNIFVASGKQICKLCAQSLRAAANFKALVLKSQKTLQLAGQNVKNESKGGIQIKREVQDSSDSDDYEADRPFFEVPVPGGSSIKAEATHDVTVEIERILDEPGGSKQPGTKRGSVRKRGSEISTDALRVWSGAGAAPRDGASSSKAKPKKKAAGKEKKSDPGPAPKKRKRRILNTEYEVLKDSTISLAANSNMTLFRWSRRHVFKCLFCEDTFQETSLLRQHTLTHRPDLVDRIRSNAQNRYIRADITDLKCAQCQRDMKDVKELTQHLETTHFVSFSSHDSLIIPFKLDELDCVECEQKFEIFAPLDTHMNSHYNRSVCEKCGKHFRGIGELRGHLRTHSIIVYKCSLCGEVFDSYYGRQKHAKEKHGVSAGRNCPICNENFLSVYAKRTHLVKVHGHKKSEHKCKLCGKVYGHKSPLAVHVRKVHLQEKNFECDVCHNGFMRKCDLKDHMKYHRNIRAFQCSYCKKDFVTRHHLNRHMAAHDESYKHICPHCGGSYTQKYYMKLHMKKCAGNNRFKVGEDAAQMDAEPS